MRDKVKIGTSNVYKCAFCKYWIGDAKVQLKWGDTYTYERNAVGICTLNNDVEKNADDFCRKLNIGYAYL